MGDLRQKFECLKIDLSLDQIYLLSHNVVASG